MPEPKKLPPQKKRPPNKPPKPDANGSDPYWRLVTYEVTDFGGLHHLKFTPVGRMVVFQGGTKAGKTSALKAVEYGLGGNYFAPERPTRDGAPGHIIKLGLAQDGTPMAFTLLRRQGGNLKIEMAPGCTAWDSDQNMLDSIFEAMAFDPVHFVNLGVNDPGKAEQVALLQRTIGLDVEEYEQRRAAAYDKRRAVNAQVEDLTPLIDAIIVNPAKLEFVDVDPIKARIHEATENNRAYASAMDRKRDLENALAEARDHEERNKELIAKMHQTIERLTADLEMMRPAIATAAVIEDNLGDLLDKANGIPEIQGIARIMLADSLKNTLAQATSYLSNVGRRKDQATSELEQARKAVQAAEAQRERLSQDVAEAQVALEQAPQPTWVETADMNEELSIAQDHNRDVAREKERRDRRDALVAQRQVKRDEAEAFTREINKAQEEKLKAVAEAKMPCEGLSWGKTSTNKDEILYHGRPLNQASGSEKLRIGVMIALARKPLLRIINVQEGESLDKKDLADLAKLAEELDFTVWMARVDESGTPGATTGIFLIDGEQVPHTETQELRARIKAEKGGTA